MTTLARYEVAAESLQGVLDDLLVAARLTRAEVGNLYFHAYVADDESLVLLEGWDSQASLDEHRRTDHFQDLVLGKIAPRLVSRTVETLHPAFKGKFA
ncbi:antibiotic biosynthesis monooxygenase [Rhodococcus qingshengii]|uniref:putative quinol monooxygenase n=1 Tax=Rhodococcus qingshengii TaxID=334542 RepID=UPI000B0DE915|nr:antibiotic biosynthesis monooxygenase [Rhodococcus qingshengii]MDJ0489914.1 antibiotic biosynthesis monooxygenase [Rhodococcus qingshengii]